MKSKGLPLEKTFVKILKTDFPSIKTVVNLGAWIGNSTLWFESKNPEMTIIAVEPMIENYIELVRKIVRGNKKNIIPVFGAISDKTGKDELFISDKSESHSFFRKKHYMDGNIKRLVSTISWDDLMDMLNVTEVGLAKVNIEGAEIKMLKGMTKVFPRKMLIEEHSSTISPKDYSLQELMNLVKEKGYRVIEYEPSGKKKDDLHLELCIKDI